MTALCVRGLACLRPLIPLAAALFLFASPALAADPITVLLDEARLIKLPERATTVVIGNPLIADASVQPGGVAVITGKGYGATNMIALDHDGAVLMENNVEVLGPSDPLVVVYKGIKRETYSCTPDCSARIRLGDDKDYFADTLTETTSRNNAAKAAGAGADASHPNQGSSAAAPQNGVTVVIQNGAGAPGSAITH